MPTMIILPDDDGLAAFIATILLTAMHTRIRSDWIVYVIIGLLSPVHGYHPSIIQLAEEIEIWADNLSALYEDRSIEADEVFYAAHRVAQFIFMKSVRDAESNSVGTVCATTKFPPMPVPSWAIAAAA